MKSDIHTLRRRQTYVEGVSV